MMPCVHRRPWPGIGDRVALGESSSTPAPTPTGRPAMPTVLITPEPLRNQPGPFRELLQAAGFRCIDFNGEQVPSEESLRALLPQVDAIIAGSELLSASVLA